VWRYGKPLLAWLVREAEETARMPGFQPADLAAFVLVGIRPELPAGRQAVHSVHQLQAACGGTHRKYVVLELSDPAIAFDQLWPLGVQARHALLGGGSATRFSKKDAEFLALVERLGGEPPRARGRKAFWERGRQE
jgi:hypothetical protein